MPLLHGLQGFRQSLGIRLGSFCDGARNKLIDGKNRINISVYGILEGNVLHAFYVGSALGRVQDPGAALFVEVSHVILEPLVEGHPIELARHRPSVQALDPLELVRALCPLFKRDIIFFYRDHALVPIYLYVLAYENYRASAHLNGDIEGRGSDAAAYGREIIRAPVLRVLGAERVRGVEEDELLLYFPSEHARVRDLSQYEPCLEVTLVVCEILRQIDLLGCDDKVRYDSV